MIFQKSVFRISALALITAGILYWIHCETIEGVGVSPYISFSVEYQQDPYLDEFDIFIYDFDLQSEEITEVYRFPGNALYALGVHDRQAHAVYYVKEEDNDRYERNRTGDQIFVHDLETGSDKMLTNDLLAVNYLIPVENAVFFVAARQENPYSLRLGRIDLRSGEVRYWDEPDTASIITISVDRKHERIYVATFDYEERYLSSMTHSPPPDYTIYSYDYNLQDKKEILRKEHMCIKALYVMDNLLLYRADTTLAPGKNTKVQSEIIDLDTKEVLYQSDERFAGRGSFAVDKSTVYGVLFDGIYEGICRYDFEKKDYMPISQSDFGTIVNFQIMY